MLTHETEIKEGKETKRYRFENVKDESEFDYWENTMQF